MTDEQKSLPGVSLTYRADIVYHGICTFFWSDTGPVLFFDQHYDALTVYERLYDALQAIWQERQHLESFLLKVQYGGRNDYDISSETFEAIRDRLQREGDEWRTVGHPWDVG